MISFSTHTEKQEEQTGTTELVNQQQLILYNDDVNSFDFVIETLVKVCKHTVEQAEQCAYLVHYTGKCDVKRGEFSVLKPLCEALLEKGLTAEIQ